MNFSLSVQKLIALALLYTEGYVFVWVLSHFFALPMSSSIVYFIVLQLVCMWYGISVVEFADAYERRNKTFDDVFYGQKIIMGGSNFFIGISGAIACILASSMIIILINPNKNPRDLF